MSNKPFVHLHCHTDYSLLDGACEIGQLMNSVAEQGMPAVAMTDHGNLFGAVKFYNAAKDKGIFRRTVPAFDPTSCTGCLECSLVCPDAAIPTQVHEIHDLWPASPIEHDQAVLQVPATKHGGTEQQVDAVLRRQAGRCLQDGGNILGPKGGEIAGIAGGGALRKQHRIGPPSRSPDAGRNRRWKRPRCRRSAPKTRSRPECQSSGCRSLCR